MINFFSSPYRPCLANEKRFRTSEILNGELGTSILGIFGFNSGLCADDSLESAVTGGLS